MILGMRRIWIGAALLIAGCSAKPHGELTFLAVGQGDCTVFREGDYTVLIDAGPKKDKFDAGERIVLPALRAMGVRDIDLVLLSHPDSDHIGGLAAVARRLPIGKVVIPAHFRSHPDMVRGLAEAKIEEGQIVWMDRRTTSKIGEFQLVMDAPPWKSSRPDNDGSMFVWIGAGKSTAEFSGDAGLEAEAIMARRSGWGAQVMHVGHHGSMTASSNAWLTAVHPKIGVISCGRDNEYGHPHAQVLQRLTRAGTQILRTDRDGAITMRSTPDGFVADK